MKAARYSDSQIMAILKQAEAGSKKMYIEAQMQADIIKEAMSEIL